MNIAPILLDELMGSVDFFLDYTNQQPSSPGFGLSVDSTKKMNVASIASTGFALTAWVIGCERGFISRQHARDITRKTLTTLMTTVSQCFGFFAHFIHMSNGQRYKKCEFSTIDTSICLNGVITAMAYFNDDEIDQLALQLLQRVDWKILVFERNEKAYFWMAYNPDHKENHPGTPPGFFAQWDMAAEQKMMYLQAANHLDQASARKLYNGFTRDIGEYRGEKIIVNPGGNLFAYQFTEAWLDTKNYLDPNGVDWFNNTRLAALANRSYCLENSDKFKTYHEHSWGMSAGDSPWGYDVSGAKPCLVEPKPNGTVSIYSAMACLPYIPELTQDMMLYIYNNHPKIWGKYGFYDAYNLEVSPPWYSQAIYGIDKGCSMIMIENYLTGLIWNLYTNSPYIQNALSVLGFTKR